MSVAEEFIVEAVGCIVTVQIYDAGFMGLLYAGDDRHIVLQMEDGLKLINVDDITTIDLVRQAEIVKPDDNLVTTREKVAT